MTKHNAKSATRMIGLAALIGIIAALVYLPSLGFGFSFDEKILITDNISIRSLKNIPQFFNSKFWPGQSQGIYYRPIVVLSYALNYAAARDNPYIYHLTNLLLHVMVSMLVLGLARKLLPKQQSAAFIAALVFAVHPLHTESVTWISGRTDVLATLFIISAWLALLGARNSAGWHSPVRKAAAAILFFLGLLSKEVAIVLPLLVIAADLILYDGKQGLADRLRPYAVEYATLALVAIIWWGLRSHALSIPGPEPAPAFFEGVSSLKRLSLMSLVWLWDIKLMLYPYPLRLDYYYSLALDPKTTTVWPGLIALAVLLGLFAGAFRLRKTLPAITVALAGTCISLLPFSHLVSIPTLMAERFLYLPSLFVCLALGAWLSRLAQSRPRPAWTLAALLIIFMSLLTIGRGSDWRDGYHFWRSSVRQVPELALAHNLMGVYALDKNNYSLAEHEFQRAVRLDPGFSQAAMNLAKIALDQGRVEDAILILQDAVSNMPGLSSAHFNLAMAYKLAGRIPDMQRQLEQAIRLDQTNLAALLALGDYYLKNNDPDSAEKLYRQAHKLDPQNLAINNRLDALEVK